MIVLEANVRKTPKIKKKTKKKIIYANMMVKVESEVKARISDTME